MNRVCHVCRRGVLDIDFPLFVYEKSLNSCVIALSCLSVSGSKEHLSGVNCTDDGTNNLMPGKTSALHSTLIFYPVLCCIAAESMFFIILSGIDISLPTISASIISFSPSINKEIEYNRIFKENCSGYPSSSLPAP